MTGSTSGHSRRGHLRGGLFFFSFLAVAACAGPGPAAGPGAAPAPGQPAGPLEVYRRAGLLAGPEHFPAVAAVAELAGPGDSTLVLVGVSLPASALRFQREGAGFSAEYVVAIRFTRDGELVAAVDRRERVRVARFDETGRTDESVVFQAPALLPPGRYTVSIRVRDALSAGGLSVTDTLEAGAPRAEPRLARPLIVHRAEPRRARADTPRVILNPRHTAHYGGEPPRVYIEAYGAGTVPVEIELVDGAGEVLWAREAVLARGVDLAAAVVRIPLDSLPIGRFAVRGRTAGAVTPAVPLLVTLSDRWLVANFGEVVELLRYVAGPEEIQALADAGPAERRDRWADFWARRDPIPATPANEFRDTFLERIAGAEAFASSGRPGWRTDRGEVYIVLGPPSRTIDRHVGREPGAATVQEWIYAPPGPRLELIFVDRTGFGDYRLTPASEASFREVARRIARQP